jgi:hypothetical protein
MMFLKIGGLSGRQTCKLGIYCRIPAWDLTFFGTLNSRFDLLQAMFDSRETSFRCETPFIRNFRSGFEPRDSFFQCGAIDRPPDKNGQRGRDGGKEQQRINRSVCDSIA